MNTNYDLTKGAHIAKWVAREKYVWPGGYALFAITSDGACLCPACCRSEFRHIAESSRWMRGDGWTVIDFGSQDQCEDEWLTCDHCGGLIFDND